LKESVRALHLFAIDLLGNPGLGFVKFFSYSVKENFTIHGLIGYEIFQVFDWDAPFAMKPFVIVV
jgi:hypothetical protein